MLLRPTHSHAACAEHNTKSTLAHPAGSEEGPAGPHSAQSTKPLESSRAAVVVFSGLGGRDSLEWIMSAELLSTPFGNPDGSRSDIQEVVDNFITFEDLP